MDAVHPAAHRSRCEVWPRPCHARSRPTRRLAEMAERRISKTWVVQCGILPHLFSIIRVPGAHPEAAYMAAKALVYVR